MTTLADFQTEVLAFTRMRGTQYIADDDIQGMYALISRSLREFTNESLCMYRADNALTLTPGQAGYDLEGSDVAQAVARVHRVYVDGGVLHAPDGGDGLYSVSDMDWFRPGWRDAVQGRPQVGLVVPPKTLILHPVPDSAYAASVSGWILHPVLDDESDLVELPEASIRLAAKWCAARLLEVHCSPDELPYVKDLMQDARSEARRMAAQYLSMMTGPQVRGRRGRPEVYTIG